MKRTLRVRDLTAMGIAAVIGAGIFSTIGNAAAAGGPAVSLLFIFTAIACGFSALCYAQFASLLPISGSAYTYAYASFGELIAWIIGWDLIMEYAVGNIAVAISWSEYFTAWLQGMGLHFPEYLGMDWLSAFKGHKEAIAQMASGVSFSGLSRSVQEAYTAWNHAPQLFGLHLVANIPAFAIVFFITVLVYIGIRETKNAGNIMVILKLVILMVVIGVGAFYVQPKNWIPFTPHGLSGVLKGVSGVFFAYIGFDAISTTAEECKNPRRDLPLSMILVLVITTVIYIIISMVLTGMVPSAELGVADPLAFAFQRLHLEWLSGFIALAAVIAMAGVILVFQVGQPRIWMSMSRDGLLPPIFSRLHPRFRTPGFSTILTGIIVGVPALFTTLTEMTDLTSIGTLFAFILVSGGVIIMEKNEDPNTVKRGFRIYYINSRIWLIPIWVVVLAILFLMGIFDIHSFASGAGSIFDWSLLKSMAHVYVFILLAVWITTKAIIRKWSLVPVLGVLTNLYLISELGTTNWLRFIIWLVIGLALYFTYGSRHSKLQKKSSTV
ncbi:MAG: amino acid permease [Bacteroidota bacterium]|nr:amino acid permease [Bacteroidota bacterium]